MVHENVRLPLLIANLLELTLDYRLGERVKLLTGTVPDALDRTRMIRHRIEAVCVCSLDGSSSLLSGQYMATHTLATKHHACFCLATIYCPICD
eukprot:3170823-Pleurochrysis_carterae.AAC.7